MPIFDKKGNIVKYFYFVDKISKDTIFETLLDAQLISRKYINKVYFAFFDYNSLKYKAFEI